MSNHDVGNTPPPPDADAPLDPAAAFRWEPEFWDEPAEKGLELVRLGLLIEGTIGILQGHFESGKTTLMLDIARRWITELGRPVLHIDYEMGRRRIRARIKSLPEWEADRKFWEALWHYDYMPNLQPGFLEQLIALLPASPLITFDSYSQAMMYLGREENSATESGNFWVGELQRARELGATILVIDQVKQSATARDKYAGRGTGAKAFGADFVWYVERFEKFTPERIGKIKLTLHKDREGVLPDALGFQVGDGEGHLVLTPIDPPKGTPIDDQAVEAVISVLEQDGWSSPNAIKQRTEGFGDATIRSTLLYLEDKGVVESRARQGRGGGMEYNLVTPDGERVIVPDIG